VAIIAAMAGELKPLVRGWAHERRDGVELWRWKFDEGEWVAACGGAGVQAATLAFAEIEREGAPDLVISAGWAGALGEEFAVGQAYWVSGVIDARTGERFVAEAASHPSDKNKDVARVGHPAADSVDFPPRSQNRDLGHPVADSVDFLPRSRNPDPLRQAQGRLSTGSGRALGHPDSLFDQRGLWLVTSPIVADRAEKKRLAAAYKAELVDMEAAGVARLALMRGIPFYCFKGVSDGFNDRLPDFNRFIRADGRFDLTRMVLFSILRPWYWPSLMRMGENSRKASQRMRESLLDFLDQQGDIRQRDGDPDHKL
jgi:nucleoside phosphorylase